MKKTPKELKMDKKEKPITKEFRKWYFSLSAEKIYLIRKDIIVKLGITGYKFANFLSGTSTPNVWERKIIVEIAETNIFNPKDKKDESSR